MIPLIDCDILRYEVGFGSEWYDDEKVKVINSFERAADLLDQKIKIIQEESWADEEPILYLTNDKRLHDRKNKERARLGYEPLIYEPNFREAVAVTKPYKGNRSAPKPFHYNNLTSYIINNYKHKIAYGIEADDLISIDHNLDPGNTIICTRDKDLRQTHGMHYGWACGKQPGFGPREIKYPGYLELVGATDEGVGGKVVGGGLLFFYLQMLTGDAVDNIPGINRFGPKKAYDLLKDCTTEKEMFEAVSGVYQGHYEDWETYYTEQADLLWMCQELDENGKEVRHVMFNRR